MPITLQIVYRRFEFEYINTIDTKQHPNATARINGTSELSHHFAAHALSGFDLPLTK